MTTEHSSFALRKAWWGVIVLFLVHGLVVSSWISRIPAIQTNLHLSNGVLGLTLLSSAIGAVLTIPVIGYMVSRFGSKRVCVLSSVSFCLGVVLMGSAKDAVSLAAALFVYGGLAAAMDVSMNAQGVEVEKGLRRPTMSRFHGMFSLGAMAGAGIGGAVAARGAPLLLHFAISGAVNLLAVLLVAPWLVKDLHGTVERQHRLPLNKIPKVLLAISAIGFCILLAEGAMADWTAVYLRQVLGAGQGTAAAGYSVFSGSMAGFRFLGDFITERLGPLRTVRLGSLVAAAGLVSALAAPSPEWSMPGFAATGAGLSVIIPLVFGSGGRVPSVSPGPGIATVTGIGYVGFIVGPPSIGFVSQIVTLRYALGIVVACCLVGSLLAGFMRELEAQPSKAEGAAVA
ncbi:MAG: MFS transporter [Bryobacteraceae bacterium]